MLEDDEILSAPHSLPSNQDRTQDPGPFTTEEILDSDHGGYDTEMIRQSPAQVSGSRDPNDPGAFDTEQVDKGGTIDKKG